MSDTIIALIIPAIMIAIIFAWVPLLNFVCPPCRRLSSQRLFDNLGHRPHPPSLFVSRVHPADLINHRHEFAWGNVTMAGGNASGEITCQTMS
jgi:hypothetical protein